MLLAPMPTFAASATFLGPIVPQACHCDNQSVQGATDGSQVNSAPDWGCVLQVIQNLVNFGVTLAMTLFTIYLVITGFSFITSAGSSEARSKAKTRFANVFIGLAVMLCAWLIVDFVMKQLYNPDATVSGVSGGTKFGPWNAILAGTPGSECIRPTEPTKIQTGVLTMISTSTGTGAGFNASAGSNSKICAAANAYQRHDTSAGPGNGVVACAWAVNNVLRNAGYAPIGGNAVSGMESALRGGRGTQISQAQATCGDIVIEASDSHVGICMNDGCTSVISNSSSRATFSWISSIDFKPSYSSGNGRIYHVNN